MKTFIDGSWWEKSLPLPASTPQHPNHAAYLQSLQDVVTARPENTVGVYNGEAYCALIGAPDPGPHPSDNWSWPIYRVSAADTQYVVVNSGTYTLPQEVVTEPGIRIPEIAKDYYDSTLTIAADREFIIDDPEAGYTVLLNRAAWNASLGQWEARGAQIAYYTSYGLDARGDDTGTIWPESLHYYADEARNGGTFRGANPMARVVPGKNTVEPRVICMTVWQPGPDHVFPYVDGEAAKTGIIPEGTRLRLRNLDFRTILTNDGLTGAALDQAVIICEMLRDYGAIVADTSGSGSYLHIENTRRKGEAHFWELTQEALRTLPFTDAYWQVVDDNYDPEPIVKPEPAPAKSTSFEAGPAGATIDPTYSGTTEDAALDGAYASTGNSITYSDLYAYSGVLSAAADASGGGSAAYVQYNLAGRDTTSRIYLWLPALPAGTVYLSEWHDAAGALTAGINLNTNGTLSLKAAGNTILGSTTATVPLSQWVRIELRNIGESAAGAADGSMELRLYNTPTDAIDSPTEAVVATAQSNTEGSYHRTGIVYRPGAGPIYIDDFAVSLNGWIGTGAPTATPLQTSVPAADVVVQGFKTNTGATTNLYTAIDEATPDDADYVINDSAAGTHVYEAALGALDNPGVDTEHTVRYRIGSSTTSPATVRVSLREGANEIAAWQHTVTDPQTVEQTLSQVQASEISNYSDLRLRFEVTVL